VTDERVRGGTENLGKLAGASRGLILALRGAPPELKLRLDAEALAPGMSDA
jgi:hypothetical protein